MLRVIAEFVGIQPVISRTFILIKTEKWVVQVARKGSRLIIETIPC